MTVWPDVRWYDVVPYRATLSKTMPQIKEAQTLKSPGLSLAAPRVEPDAATLPWLQRLTEGANIRGRIKTSSGMVLQLSPEEPLFEVTFHREDLLKTVQDEFSLGQAYVNGHIDIEGDILAMLEARDALRERFRLLPSFRFAKNLFLRSATSVNQEAITDHYTLGDDLYLTFIDRKYRFYSHCIFESDDETLEQAAEHKLETMFRALELRPGMRLLDIGGGWGGLHEYASPRGVKVTSVTLVRDSYNYIINLLQNKQLDGNVVLSDFLSYSTQQPFDAVVIYGVIEHIPYYRQFFERVWGCLKPGGKIYIDASATKEKYSMSQFTRFYTWHGTHTFLCLQDLIREALFAGFQFVEAEEETHDYELTMWHWATRLDESREQVVARWGEKVYRAFRLFLWGGCHAFKTDRLQAYHVVARRGSGPGPRPGRTKRFVQFLREVA